MLQAGQIEPSLAMALLGQVMPTKPEEPQEADDTKSQGLKRPLEEPPSAETREATEVTVDEILAQAKKTKLDPWMVKWHAEALYSMYVLVLVVSQLHDP